MNFPHEIFPKTEKKNNENISDSIRNDFFNVCAWFGCKIYLRDEEGMYLSEGGGFLYTCICLLVNMDITVVIIPFIIQITSHFLVRIRYILGVAKITNL